MPVREKSWEDPKRLVLSRCSPEMSSKTASGAQGERQVTVPLHDNLDPLHYKLMSAAQGHRPRSKEIVQEHERSGPNPGRKPEVRIHS